MDEKQSEESDQLPEEGPSGDVPEDDSGGEQRSEVEENPGAPDREGQATGNPKNAG